MIEKNEGRSEETIGCTKEMFSAIAAKVVKIRVALMALELPSRCRKAGCTLANVFAGKISMSSNTSRDVNKIGAPISRKGIPLAGVKSSKTAMATTNRDIMNANIVDETEERRNCLDRKAGTISFLASNKKIRNIEIIALDRENAS